MAAHPHRDRCYNDSHWEEASGRFDSGSSVHDMPPNSGMRRDSGSHAIPRHVGVGSREERDYARGKYRDDRDRDYQSRHGDKYLPSSRRYSQGESIRTPETASMTNSSGIYSSVRRSDSGASSFITVPSPLERGPSLDMSSSRLSQSDSHRRGGYDDPYNEHARRYHPEDRPRRDDPRYHPEDRPSSSRPYHSVHHPQDSRRPSFPRHGGPPPPRDYDYPDHPDYYPEPSRRSSYNDRPTRERPRMSDDRSYVSAMDEREYGMRSGSRRPYGEPRGYSHSRYPELEEYDRRPPSYDDRSYHSHQPERSYRPSYDDRRSYHHDGEENYPPPMSMRRGGVGSIPEDGVSKQLQPPRLPPRRNNRDRGNVAQMPPRNASRSSTITSDSRLDYDAAYFNNNGGHTSPSSDHDSVVMVDISPGVKARLRRIQETMDAVARDYYTAVSCLACNRDLFCITDVSWFLCPTCKTVNPLQEHPEHHGLGLGFTADTLMAMQSELYAKNGGCAYNGMR